MQFYGIINQMAILFLVIFIGYIAAKFKILDDVASHRFSKFVINLTAPALIISSVTGNYDLGGIKDMLTALFLACGFFIIIPFITMPIVRLLKVPQEDENLYRFMLIFYNNVFMGFPVVRSLFGEGAIFYASIFNFPCTLLLYTLGIYLVKSQKNSISVFEVRKLINPGIFAVIIAMFIFIFKIQMPVFLCDTIRMIGSITTPLSLIVIGASLSAIPIKEVFKEKTLYPIAFITLIGIPVILLLLLRGIIINKVILGVTVIISGMPVASIAVMFCNEYKGNIELATKAILLTTLFSMISIPLLTFLIYIF